MITPDFDYLCGEICELLEANGISEDDVPDLWEMIEKFTRIVLKKLAKAQAQSLSSEED